MGRMRPILERFNEKWIPEPNTGCWLWEAACLPHGYGIIGYSKYGRVPVKAHRLSYELFVEPVPPGMFVLHKCDVPACVNPDHLFIGSQRSNMEDKVSKNRQRPGEQHPNSILKWETVHQIREEYAMGKTSLSKLGTKHGLCFQHVHDIIKNKIWRESSHAG